MVLLLHIQISVDRLRRREMKEARLPTNKVDVEEEFRLAQFCEHNFFTGTQDSPKKSSKLENVGRVALKKVVWQLKDQIKAVPTAMYIFIS